MSQRDAGSSEDVRFRRLVSAVILQALDDLYKGSGRQRQSVRDWLAGKNENSLSFELCCKPLDRDADDSRHKLEARRL